MKATEDGFILESTRKEIFTYGTEGLSIDSDNNIRVGHDSYVEYFDSETLEYKSDFTDEEKKEIAKAVIEKWVSFSGLAVNFV